MARDEQAMRVAIIGAGIGGVSLGLALRQRGIDAEIYDAANELTEVGAGIGLAANSMRLLLTLGLGDELARDTIIPADLVFRDGRTGKTIARQAIGEDNVYVEKFGAPLVLFPRKELQRILVAAFGIDHLHLGCRLRRIDESPRAQRIEFDNGTALDADIVVGADGLRSIVRRYVSPATVVSYSGTSGFRGLLPADRLPGLPGADSLQFWMGETSHIVHYPLGRDGALINMLAVAEGPASWAGGSTMPATPQEALTAFDGWHPAVGEMLSLAAPALRWGLFTTPSMTCWHRHRSVLIGDAAHAMLPHHGQGANATIEDAFVLADTLAALPRLPDDDEVAAAFAGYQRRRRARTRQIQLASRAANDLLHLPPGPQAAARDTELMNLLPRVAWIHGFNALPSETSAITPDDLAPFATARRP